MSSSITIRTARGDDAPALAEIYAYYVENTAISFEYTAPSVQEFRGRILTTLERYPYLVALEGGIPVGYAYASPFHSRAAFAWNVEISVYVRRDMRGRGVGRALYNVIEKKLFDMGVLNINASIAYPVQEDEYLTLASVRFHESMGYTMAGRFHCSGYKFGRWYDLVWMEKLIGSHTASPAAVRGFCDTDNTAE